MRWNFLLVVAIAVRIDYGGDHTNEERNVA